jgi:hypothetical protein
LTNVIYIYIDMKFNATYFGYIVAVSFIAVINRRNLRPEICCTSSWFNLILSWTSNDFFFHIYLFAKIMGYNILMKWEKKVQGFNFILMFITVKNNALDICSCAIQFQTFYIINLKLQLLLNFIVYRYSD